MNLKKSILSYVTKSHFEGYNSIAKFTRVSNSEIGLATYIGANCKIIGTKIGKFCSIGSNVKIVFGTHPINNNVSTHPCFYAKNTTGLYFEQGYVFEEYKYIDMAKTFYVQIGNDVWIGDDVKILQGVKIGDGAVVATGAIVNHDVKPYEIVAGVPAKVIKKRFCDDEVRFLENHKWWDEDLKWIKENASVFQNIAQYKKVVYERTNKC